VLQRIVRIYFIIFVSFSYSNIFSQDQSNISRIPINGFCKYKNFKTDQDYFSIFSLNYNNDSYSDLLLFSPVKKEMALLTGTENGNFPKQRKLESRFRFSNIQALFSKNKETKDYAFTSRRDRTAGIFQISANEKISILKTLEFKSYPENISTADINGDGEDEMLISGSAFDGLSLLIDSGKKLIEKKIEERTIYTDAIFVDLNNDNVPDIAGFNLITNSVELFYNYGNGTFKKVRSIPIDGRVRSIYSFDINADDYEDLIFVKDKSIIIFYGDFRSSFEKSITINPEYYPDKIIIGDFNKDGKIDIAYINYDEEILSVIFAKDEMSFYPGIIYLKKIGIKNIIPFYSRFINGICGISSRGELFTITTLSSFSENVQITLAAKPTTINFFDSNDNGIIDLCFLDEYTNSLITVTRDNAGIPNSYYSFPLFQTQSELSVYNISPNVEAFYCYSPGKKLVETFIVNYSTGSFDRNSFYSHGDILDLKLKKGPEGKINTYTVYRKDDILGLDIFHYSEHNYSNTNSEIKIKDIASNVMLGSNESIYFWQKLNDGLKFFSKDFSDNSSPIKERFSLSLKEYFKIISFTGDLLNKDKDASISFMASEKDTIAVVSKDRQSSIIKRSSQTGSFNLENKDQVYFGEMRFNGLKKLFIYYPRKQRVDKIDFLNEGGKLISTKIAEVSNLNRYFIKNMNFNNYHIVFTKKNDSPISIKKINP
jgi:FG-GAP-like repeat